MLKVFKLSLRNVWRNKRRTVITISMIAFGMIVTLLISGFLGAISNDLKDSLIEGNTGDIQIMANGYKEEKISGTLDYTIPDTSTFIRELEEEPEIEAVTRRIAVNGMLSNGKDTIYTRGTAIELSTVKAALPKLLEAQTLDQPLRISGREGGIIGEGVAKKLDVEVGDTLFLVVYDQYGGMNAANITITDIAKYSTDAENDTKIIMTYDSAANMLGLEGRATSICVRVKDRSKVDQLVKKYNEKYGAKYDVEFYSWKELMGSFGQTIGMFQAVKLIILIIMAVVVLISIINTILMSVFERTGEIGTLRAIGTSRKRITAVFMAESFWLGLIGILIGVSFGVVIIYLTAIKGIPFKAPGTTQVFYIEPILELNMVVGSSIVILIVSILAGIYPARFAAKLNPIEAIRRL